MLAISELKNILNGEKAEEVFKRLYCEKSLETQRLRYLSIIDDFEKTFPGFREAAFFSSPGRTEICGNHTDHNHGLVLSGAVTLDAVAAASVSEDSVIVIESEGYPVDVVDLGNLSPVEEEMHTSRALIRGIASRLKELGFRVGGFRAKVKSDVLKGSGLSSSASFEVLVGSILNSLYNLGAVPEIEIAKAGQYAENRFFGKPCGLMDQITCTFGGLVFIDFRNPDQPEIIKYDYDFQSSGCSIVIVDTGSSHASLTDDYAAVTREMAAVSKALDVNILRDSDKDRLIANMASVRSVAGDRAVLRAMHFFDENERVCLVNDALCTGNFDLFLYSIRQSGLSSWTLLQNCYSPDRPEEQGIPLALAMSSDILGDKGAFRVHGGGFAGTIQAFVPDKILPVFIEKMQRVFGANSCYPLSVRIQGAVEVFPKG